jgi:hypothetical protein
MRFETPHSLCRAGIARGDITPPVGVYHRMWGAATHDRSTGVHRPLTATALALRPADGEELADEELVLLAIDHCLLWREEMDALLDRVSASAGIPRERLLVMFSHTHAAGLMGLERGELPGGNLIAPYLERLAETLAQLGRKARAEMRSALITYGRGSCQLAAHRDLWDAASGQWVCGFHPAGPADDTLVVARITEPAGRPLATVVNYACHPTTLAWQNTLISPDYVGAMREVVERVTEAPVVFIQGASGDLGPRRGYTGDLAIADANGRQLGHAVLATLESLPPPATRYEYAGPVVSGAIIGLWRDVPLSADDLQSKAGWRCRRWTVDLPYRPSLRSAAEVAAERELRQQEEQAARVAGNGSLATERRAQVEVLTRQLVRLRCLPPGPTYPFPIVLWQIGDAVWVAVESEHYQQLQVELRQRFANAKLTIVVATIVNGRLHTYLPPREIYGSGIYQETVALLAAGCLERLIEEIGDQIAAWQAVGHDGCTASQPETS